MLKALGLSRASKAETHPPQTADDINAILNTGIQVENALLVMDNVLDGQIDQAESLTEQGHGPFRKVATGVLHFIQATVSFEPEAIYQAVNSLSESENAASKMKSHAQSLGVKATRFRPGAEFELVEYESALLGGISMLLTESKIEIVKALYKIRKVYLSLEELRKHVNTVLAEPSTTNPDEVPGTTAYVKLAGVDFTKFRSLHAERTKRSFKPTSEDFQPSQSFEEYICSGVDTMSGLLHLILSSVPPNISRLLSVIGLHGEREPALDMLWRASENYKNIHGSLALLSLIMFFDGQLQFKDIELSKSDEDKISNDVSNKATGKSTNKLTPRDISDTRVRLNNALKELRSYYPHGVLWLLLQGRLVTHDDVKAGVAILESDECGPNQMRQVEGLLMFDRVLFLLSLNRLEEATSEFLKLMEVSTWSHPLYMFMAGACQLELYRACEDKSSEKAKEYKLKAREYLSKAPKVGGKKKVLGRKMPFDSLVARKVELYERAASRYKLDLEDAVSGSPLYEYLYFWNGPSRMLPEVAKQVVTKLDHSKTAPVPETKDSIFTRKLMQSIYMRRAGDVETGFKLIEEILPQAIKGDIMGEHNKRVSYTSIGEPWAGAACLYERGVYNWVVDGPKSAPLVRRFLDLSADWNDDYELSTRINMKITSARDRLDIYRM